MRQRPVVVISVCLLLIAGATGFQLRGQILHQLDVHGVIPGSAPLGGGTLWTCPSGWLKAYQSSMLYYPFNHPDLPSLVTKPTRCYRTDGEAKSAGYRLAPPPKGGAVLDGVYLVPSTNQVRTSCEAAAAELRIAIPCPTLLPLGAADRFCFRCTDGGEFVAVIEFTTPPDYPGAQLPKGFVDHKILLVILAAPLSSTDGQFANECPRGNFGPTVMGRPTLWASCNLPTGGSSSSLIWEVDNWIYQVGADPPPSSVELRMIQFFASKLVAVSTTGG